LSRIKCRLNWQLGANVSDKPTALIFALTVMEADSIETLASMYQNK
jgi:hypothetical protein